MTAVGQDFVLYAGNTKDIEVLVIGISQDDTVEWALMDSPVSKKCVLNKSTGNGITIGTDKFTIRINKADTQDLQGSFHHEAKITDSAGNVYTVTTGSVHIKPSGL